MPDAVQPGQPVQPVQPVQPGPDTDPRRAHWATLGAVSAGGALGALARHALTTAFPHTPGGFGWAVFTVNVTGCLLIGMLMVAITEVWRAPRLARPFLGVGVLGGFTTFSAYTQDALAAGNPRTALAYLTGTALAALAAVFTGMRLMRRIARCGRTRREGP